jgi:rsbT co-antagonist protein RsbR
MDAQALKLIPQGSAELEALEAGYTQAEEALQGRGGRFQALLDSASSAIVIVNGDGCIVLVNAKTERMFGYDRHELLGKAFEVLVPERFRSAYVGHRAQFLSDPSARPMDLGLDPVGRRNDGTEFPIEIGLSYVKTKRGTLVKSFIADITERKRAEETLARHAEEIAFLR